MRVIVKGVCLSKNYGHMQACDNYYTNCIYLDTILFIKYRRYIYIISKNIYICYVLHDDYRRLAMELLSLTAVMLEGLGFNLCVAPFLNICVLNLPQRVGDGECQRWSELGWKCCTRVKQGETESDCSEDEG